MYVYEFFLDSTLEYPSQVSTTLRLRRVGVVVLQKDDQFIAIPVRLNESIARDMLPARSGYEYRMDEEEAHVWEKMNGVVYNLNAKELEAYYRPFALKQQEKPKGFTAMFFKHNPPMVPSVEVRTRRNYGEAKPQYYLYNGQDSVDVTYIKTNSFLDASLIRKSTESGVSKHLLQRVSDFVHDGTVYEETLEDKNAPNQLGPKPVVEHRGAPYVDATAVPRPSVMDAFGQNVNIL